MGTRREFIRQSLGLRALGIPAAGALLANATVHGQAQRQGRVLGYDHVALPMQNVERMAAFYKGLGWTVEPSPQLMTVVFGDQKINFHMPSLWQRESFTLRGPAARPGCGDLCFVWEGSADTLKALLSRAGATVIEGPVQRAGGRGGGKANGTSVYVRDPDGNLLEFIDYDS